MEVLNNMIVIVDRQNMHRSLPSAMIKHHSSLYVDDLMLFLTPLQAKHNYIRAILNLFLDTSGLITNLEKCSCQFDAH